MLKIHEYAVTAATVEAGSFFDIDQDLGGGMFQSQKVPLSVMQVAIGTLYCADGQLKESRQVDLDGKTLQFLNGQVGFGLAPTLSPPAGVGVIQNVDWNTGNNQTIDLENADNDVAVTLASPLPGGIYTIKVIQGANLVNLTWPGTVKWESGAPLGVTPIDNAVDVITLFFDGVNYQASFGTNFA